MISFFFFSKIWRCVCEIILAWLVAILISFVPAIYMPSSGTIRVDNQVCLIHWHEAIGYFATVIIGTVVTSMLFSTFNFVKIIIWRLKWTFQMTKEKLSAASIEYLIEPTNVVCLVLFIIFWSSWIPFSIDIYRFVRESRTPSTFSFWLGGAQGIWKFPVMFVFCPRYRQFFTSFCEAKATESVTTFDYERRC